MAEEFDNPYLDEFGKGRRGRGDREYLKRKYSYAVPTEEAIRTLVLYSPIIEIGAGTGYWASLLKNAGADVLAFDDFDTRQEYWNDRLGSEYQEFFCVQNGGPEKLADHLDRTLFLCWPDPPSEPDEEEGLAGQSLKLFSGEHVAYVGCRPDQDLITGDRAFFDLLEHGYDLVERVLLPSWESAEKEDALRVYRRKDY